MDAICFVVTHETRRNKENRVCRNMDDAKHADAAANIFDRPDAAGPRKKNILVVSDYFPENVVQSAHGLFQRMRLFLDALAEIGELHLFFFVAKHVGVDRETAARYEKEIAEHWHLAIRLTLVHRSSSPTPPLLNRAFWQGPFARNTGGELQIVALERALDSKPDLVFLHRLDAGYTFLKCRNNALNMVFDLDDIEHIAFARSIRQPPRWRSKYLWYALVPGILRLERKVAKRAFVTFVCSKKDAHYLKTYWRYPRVQVVPNAVDVPPKASKDALSGQSAPAILFVGSFSYGPNAVAADFLVERLWPSVRAQYPDVELWLVGAKPERISVYKKAPEGVKFFGFVEKLDEIYARAALVCCPIFSGGGTRIKILEAAAFGKAVVATTLGAEGIEFKNGVEILLHDDLEKMAQACHSLLIDPARAARIGAAARQSIERNYARNEIKRLICATVAPLSSSTS